MKEEKQKIPESLYAIRDLTNDEIIWNARGGAYHDASSMVRKLHKLVKDNPDNKYAIIRWGLRGSALAR